MALIITSGSKSVSHSWKECFILSPFVLYSQGAVTDGIELIGIILVLFQHEADNKWITLFS